MSEEKDAIHLFLGDEDVTSDTFDDTGHCRIYETLSQTIPAEEEDWSRQRFEATASDCTQCVDGGKIATNGACIFIENLTELIQTEE